MIDPIFSPFTRWNFYTTCTVGVMLFLAFFFFLSIILMESVKHLICNGDSRLFFSISLSLSRSSLLLRRMTTAFICVHRFMFVLFAYMLFSSSLFLFFSLDCKRAREKERHINRGRWWRARCWFFPSFYSCVCIFSMLWEGTWFESRLARSLFFSRVTYIVIVLLSNIVEWEKKYKTPVLSSSFFSILGDDVGKWRSEPNASVCFIKKN